MPSLVLWDDADDEAALLAEVDARFRRLRAERDRAVTDPEGTARFAGMARQYGSYARPGVLLGMARSGLDPDSPTARQVAEIAGRKMVRETPAAGYGDVVDGGWWQQLMEAKNTFARGTMLGLAAPMQELSAVVTSAGAAALGGERFSDVYGRAAKSELRYAGEELARRVREDGFQMSDLTRGSDEFIGGGLLPAGELRARFEAEKEDVRVDGLFATPGRVAVGAVNRLAGRTVVEPGSQAYGFVSGLVDFAANVVADPSAWLLGGVAAYGKAARTFGATVNDLPAAARAVHAAASFVGPRRGVVGETVAEFLANPRTGGQVVDALVGERSANRIFRGFGGKVDPDVAVRLADATDERAVREVLSDVLGVGMGGAKPDAAQFRPRRSDVTIDTARLPGVRRNLHGLRVFQQAPKQVLDLNDTRQAATNFDAYLRNSKLPDATVNRYVDELLRADAMDWESVHGIVERANRDIVVDLVGRGVDNEKADALVARVAAGGTRAERAARAYILDAYGEHIIPPWARKKQEIAVRGTGELIERDVDGGVATLLVHSRGDAIVLPDVRELRRAASWMRPLFDARIIGPASRGTIDFLADSLTPAWKALALLRPALILRVLPDEQARIAAEGNVSLWNHPAQAIAYMLGRTGKVDPAGNLFRDLPEFRSAMNSRNRWDTPDGRSLPGWVASGDYTRAVSRLPDGTVNPDAVGWWATRIAHLAADPVTRRAAQDNDVNATVAWFLDSPERDRLVRQLGADKLRDDKVAAEYIRETVYRALHDGLGGNWRAGVAGNADLLDGVANGRIGEYPVTWDAVGGLGGEPVVFSDRAEMGAVTAYLGEIADEFIPAMLPKPRLKAQERGWRAQLDGLVDGLFSVFLSRPSDVASRSPLYAQKLWQEAERLLPFMTDELRDLTVANARKANLPRKQIDRIVARSARGGDGTIDELMTVEKLTHAHAASEVKRLLYDLANRSQFTEVMRVIMPFAEPWRETLTTWGRLVHEQPRVLRRGQQLVEGARGAGFFYTDGFGEEKFAYPGGHLLAKLAGVPADAGQVDLVANASGVNLLAQGFLPGFGPVVQLPAGMLLDRADNPALDGLRDFVIPFGAQEGPDSPGSWVDSLLPAWMKRLVTAWNADPESDRVYANTVMDVASMLATSGEYTDPLGTIGPEDANRLIADAKRHARRLYVIRGLAQSTLPTGPQPHMSVDTPDGLVALRALSDEYRRMQEDTDAGGYDTALERFVEKFGFDATLALQPKSKAIRYRSTSKEGADWERRHRDLVDRFPLAGAFFAPDSADALLDVTAYRRQLESGDREALQPDEVVQLHNRMLGSLAVAQAERQLGDAATTREGRELLSRIRADLRREFPGYGVQVGIPQGARPEQVIAEFARAIEDPELADTPVAEATREWLRLRKLADRWAVELDGRASGFQRAKAAAPVREWLRREASELLAEYPEWTNAYERVFARELEQADDDEPAAAPDEGLVIV